jgi:hypothetical protein
MVLLHSNYFPPLHHEIAGVLGENKLAIVFIDNKQEYTIK